MFEWMKKGLPHPENLPGGLNSIKEEIERQVKAVVQGLLSRMDLVTRDELDVQLNVLMRTREKLEALEVRLSALESGRLNTTPAPHSADSSSNETTATPSQH